jgi:hypothetical protein
MRGAIDYLRKHWQALVRYTTDGKLAIDKWSCGTRYVA